VKTIFLIFILLGCNAQGQKSIVIKSCYFGGSASSASRNYICQKLIFENEVPEVKIDYALNGWQVLDSIYYRIVGGRLCSLEYRPSYDVKNKRLEKYIYIKEECNSKSITNDILNLKKDKYDLLLPYLKDLQFLISRGAKKTGEHSYYFENGIIPSLFLQFGIPSNETLTSFCFDIFEGLLLKETYDFEHYTLIRHYEYDKTIMLKKVQTTTMDKRSDVKSTWSELFTTSM
jgi:hypothetical protein